ncbi:MAG: DegT/DnrJ/EryC1/StrS family aminotransferase [Pseudomonadota bacterium]
MIRFLDLRAQYHRIKPEVDAAIAKVIESSGFIGGDELRAFETEFAKYQQAEHCVGVANGTDALEIAFEALDLPPGSDIIVPAHTFISSSEAVTRAGHRVAFADVDSNGLLDPADVKRKITDATRAMMVVHLYGQPAPMNALLDIAREHDLKVIEDCAQAHGAEINSRRVGTLGDIGTFSFYPGKNLGAYGDAGAIVTNDDALARRCKMIANHGRISKYDHEFEGRNSRLDGLQAAILRVKLHHLDSWLDQRIRIAETYNQVLDGITELGLPTWQDVRHVFHLYVVRTTRRDELREFLSGADIQTGIHYPVALPDLMAYGYLNEAGAYKMATALAGQVLSLPIGEHMQESDAHEVAMHVRSFFEAQGEPAARHADAGNRS